MGATQQVLAAGGSAPSTLLNSLVDYWPLSEASGSRVGAHSAISLTDTNTVTGAAGVGSSLASQFTAANTEYLVTPNSAALQAGNFDFTLCAWVYLDTKPAAAAVLSRYNITGSQLEFLIQFASSNSRIAFFLVDSTGASQTATNLTTINTGQWYFILAYHEQGVEMGIHINNGSAQVGSRTVGVATKTCDFRIGNWENGVSHRAWNGRIQRVGYWKRLLTTGEKTALYNSGNGLDYPF